MTLMRFFSLKHSSFIGFLCYNWIEKREEKKVEKKLIEVQFPFKAQYYTTTFYSSTSFAKKLLFHIFLFCFCFGFGYINMEVRNHASVLRQASNLLINMTPRFPVFATVWHIYKERMKTMTYSFFIVLL